MAAALLQQARHVHQGRAHGGRVELFAALQTQHIFKEAERLVHFAHHLVHFAQVGGGGQADVGIRRRFLCSASEDLAGKFIKPLKGARLQSHRQQVVQLNQLGRSGRVSADVARFAQQLLCFRHALQAQQQGAQQPRHFFALLVPGRQVFARKVVGTLGLHRSLFQLVLLMQLHCGLKSLCQLDWHFHAHPQSAMQFPTLSSVPIPNLARPHEDSGVPELPAIPVKSGQVVGSPVVARSSSILTNHRLRGLVKDLAVAVLHSSMSNVE